MDDITLILPPNNWRKTSTKTRIETYTYLLSGDTPKTGERHPLKQGLKLPNDGIFQLVKFDWRKTSTKTRIETTSPR